jgi:prepilin-type N-terminal cleavage/methylation domain-containing protein
VRNGDFKSFMPPAPSRKLNRGFSLVEISVVLGIALILGAITVPNMVAVIAHSRLHAGLASMSGLVQNCRMLAVKQNKTLSALFEAEDDALVGYVKSVTDTSPRKSSDPQVKWEAPIAMVTAPFGDDPPAPLGSTELGFSPQTVIPSFNARGLPCVYVSGVCTNHGFLYYFKDTRLQGGKGWAALSITPAGRIKKWFWNGHEWTD